MIKHDYGYMANKRDRIRPVYLDDKKTSAWPKIWLAVAYIAIGSVMAITLYGFLD